VVTGPDGMTAVESEMDLTVATPVAEQQVLEPFPAFCKKDAEVPCQYQDPEVTVCAAKLLQKRQQAHLFLVFPHVTAVQKPNLAVELPACKKYIVDGPARGLVEGLIEIAGIDQKT